MHYVVYKTTNLVNGKIYIGKHQTKDVNDDYLGSGKLIQSAIKKYGRENFAKEILFTFKTEEEMNSKEAEIVSEEFIKSAHNYNMCIGGLGGFGYIQNHPKKKEWSKRGGRNSIKKVNELYGSGEITRKNLFDTESSLRANAHRIKHGLTPEHKEKIRIAALKREAAKRTRDDLN